MADMTAAKNARQNAALDKPLVTEDYDSSTWRERIERGDFAHRIKRTLSNGVTRYGLITVQSADEAARAGRDASRAPYYPCPKLVFDACDALPNVGEA